MNLKIRLQNNEEIEARSEEWLAAILLEMPEEIRTRVYERIRKKNVFYSTPGSHILHAESGFLSVLGKR